MTKVLHITPKLIIGQKISLKKRIKISLKKCLGCIGKTFRTSCINVMRAFLLVKLRCLHCTHVLLIRKRYPSVVFLNLSCWSDLMRHLL